MNYVPVVSAHEHGVRCPQNTLLFSFCASCVLISNILNELCQHVSNMVTYATRAVPPLATRSHAYLLFIAIHGFLLYFILHLYDELCSHSIYAPKICCIARNTKKV